MDLIEYYPTDDKLKLLKREGELIRELNATLNNNIAGRTKSEYKIDNITLITEQNKNWYNRNKDILYEKHRNWIKSNKEKHSKIIQNWREKNKSEINEKQKQYHIANKISINQKHIENYDKNKERIAEKRKEKYTCECGSCIRIADKTKHFKSQKHINYIQSLANVKV
jgi:hypothetical protein